MLDLKTFFFNKLKIIKTWIKKKFKSEIEVQQIKKKLWTEYHFYNLYEHKLNPRFFKKIFEIIDKDLKKEDFNYVFLVEVFFGNTTLTIDYSNLWNKFDSQLFGLHLWALFNKSVIEIYKELGDITTIIIKIKQCKKEI